MKKYIRLLKGKCEFLSFDVVDGKISNLMHFFGGRWHMGAKELYRALEASVAFNRLDLWGDEVSEKECKQVIENYRLQNEKNNTTYIKLNDEKHTLISFNNHNGVISNINVYDGTEWKLASPFYIQLILMASSNNRLEYFGKILTKKQCIDEIISNIHKNSSNEVNNGKY